MIQICTDCREACVGITSFHGFLQSGLNFRFTLFILDQKKKEKNKGAVHVMLEVNFRVYIFTKKGAPKRARFFSK